MKKKICLFLVLTLLLLLPACGATKPAEPQIEAAYKDITAEYEGFKASYFNIERKDDLLCLDMETEGGSSMMMHGSHVSLDEQFVQCLEQLSCRTEDSVSHYEYRITGEADTLFIMPPALLRGKAIEPLSLTLPAPEAYSAEQEPLKAQLEGNDRFTITKIEKNPGGEVAVTVIGSDGARFVPRQATLTVGKNAYSGGLDFSLTELNKAGDVRMLFEVAPSDADKLEGMTLTIEEVYEILSPDEPVMTKIR